MSIRGWLFPGQGAGSKVKAHKTSGGRKMPVRHTIPLGIVVFLVPINIHILYDPFKHGCSFFRFLPPWTLNIFASVTELSVFPTLHWVMGYGHGQLDGDPDMLGSVEKRLSIPPFLSYHAILPDCPHHSLPNCPYPIQPNCRHPLIGLPKCPYPIQPNCSFPILYTQQS